MKSQKRISQISKQSRIATPKVNIWYYNKEILTSQRPGSEVNSLRNDRSTILKDEGMKYSKDNQLITKSRRECLFVVDWQLEDNS